MELNNGERIDDLQYNGLKIIQNPNFFRFGSDAVELANFVTGGRRDKAVDLGSGSGIISILLAGKKGINVTAVEIQEQVALLSEKSVELNGLQDKIKVINAPMQKIADYLERGSQTIVVSNPPYAKANSGEKSIEDTVAISRTEIAVTLEEVIKCASYLLSTGGKFYLVHRTDRMAEVITLCTNFALEPKQLQVLIPKQGKKSHIFLLKCVKDGKVGLDVLPERQIVDYV